MDTYRLMTNGEIYNNPWLHRQAVVFSGKNRVENTEGTLETRIGEVEDVLGETITSINETVSDEKPRTRYGYGYSSEGKHLKKEMKGEYIDEEA